MWCNFYSGFSTVVAIYIVTKKYPTDQLQVFQIPVYYYVCLCTQQYTYQNHDAYAWLFKLFPSHLSKVHHASFFNSFLRSVLNYCDTFNIEETNIWYLWFILFLHKDQFSFAIFIYYRYFIWVILFYYVS